MSTTGISNTDTKPSYKLLRLKQVLELTGLGRSTVYDLMSQNSPRYDPSFPQSIKMTAATVCWVEAEIMAWIEGKIAQSRAA